MISPNGSKITTGSTHLFDAQGGVWTQDEQTNFRRNGEIKGWGDLMQIFDGVIHMQNGPGRVYKWLGAADGQLIHYTGPFPPNAPTGLPLEIDFEVVPLNYPDGTTVELRAYIVSGTPPPIKPFMGGQGFFFRLPASIPPPPNDPNPTERAATTAKRKWPHGSQQEVTLEYHYDSGDGVVQVLGRTKKTITVP